MKNINTIFYSIITVSIFSISYASVGEKAANIAAKGLEEASQKLSNDLGRASQAFTDAAPTVGADTVKILGEAGKDISKNLALGVGIIAGVYALKDIVYMGKDFYQYCCPNEDKKEQIRQTRERIAILDTKNAFRECFMKNAKGQRNKEDIPVACEECGDAFAAMAGTAAFQDMAETLKWAYLRRLA